MSKRCDSCAGPFGLVVHRWLGYKFCTKKCKEHFLALRSQQIERMRQWLGGTSTRGVAVRD
jgi:hypothetical protein